MRNEEDKEKEKETFREIELELTEKEIEQSTAKPKEFQEEMKQECIKVLGVEMYYEVYKYLKEVKAKNIKFSVMHERINNMLKKDKRKMSMVFFVDQLVDMEIKGKYV